MSEIWCQRSSQISNLNFIYQLLNCPKANFGLIQGGSLTHPVLVTVLVNRGLVMRLGPKAWPGTSVGFKPSIFWFRANALSHKSAPAPLSIVPFSHVPLPLHRTDEIFFI